MAYPRRTLTRRAVLGYDQLRRITKGSGSQWPDLLIKDYQGIIQDFAFLADSNDDLDSRIVENESNIEINKTDIKANKDNLETHVSSNSEHGVTGDNVGTEDFCTDVIGGVVLLMDLVNDAVNSTQEITIADITDAPNAYDQNHIQTLVDMANDTKENTIS